MNDFNVFMDELPLWSAPFGLKLLDRQEKVFARIEACLNETAGQKGHVRLTIPFMILDRVPVF